MSVFGGCRQSVAKLAGLYRRMVFYAVARGHKPGIYENWASCESQVKGFQHARYKKFQTRNEAENFIKEFGGESAAAAVVAVAQSSVKAQEFWPESDGDSFTAITDEDLLYALYEVEGLPDKASTSTNPLKRKADGGGTAGSSKFPKYVSTVLTVAGYIHKNKQDFPIDDEGFVIVYTDGSCINNGQENASAGYGVYFAKDHPLNAAQPVVGRVTNNVGEIQAATHAIQLAKELGIGKLCVCTDSQFLINAVTCWMKAWKRKDWRLKNGEPVKNVADFKILDLLLEDGKINVKWNYVKGHARIEGNDMADKLARAGAAKYAANSKN